MNFYHFLFQVVGQDLGRISLLEPTDFKDGLFRKFNVSSTSSLEEDESDLCTSSCVYLTCPSCSSSVSSVAAEIVGSTVAFAVQWLGIFIRVQLPQNCVAVLVCCLLLCSYYLQLLFRHVFARRSSCFLCEAAANRWISDGDGEPSSVLPSSDLSSFISFTPFLFLLLSFPGVCLGYVSSCSELAPACI